MLHFWKILIYVSKIIISLGFHIFIVFRNLFLRRREKFCIIHKNYLLYFIIRGWNLWHPRRMSWKYYEIFEIAFYCIIDRFLIRVHYIVIYVCVYTHTSFILKLEFTYSQNCVHLFSLPIYTIPYTIWNQNCICG